MRRTILLRCVFVFAGGRTAMRRNKHHGGFALTVPVCLMIFVGQVYAQGTWTTKAPMPTPRWGLSAGVVNGTVYALGGVPVSATCSFLGTNEAYDPTTDTWTSKASMPTARESLAAGVVNGILYAVGGGTGCGPISAALEAYDPVANSWTTKAPMPTVRRLHAAGVVNGILYVVGGFDGFTTLATVLAYNPLTDTWTTKAPMAAPRYQLRAGVVNSILYAVGGVAAGSLVGTVEAYDPTTDTWTTKASMPTARGCFGVAVVSGTLYAVGGCSSSGSIGTLEAYDAATDTWTTDAPMPTARFEVAAAAVNGTLYALGGENTSNTVFATNEAFTPAVPFASFSAEVEIKDNFTAFEADGNFMLGTGSNGINPLTEAVGLQVGTFSTTIPAGSFTQDEEGNFTFEGVISGVSLEVEIQPLGGGSFGFLAEGTGANLSGTANPVPVTLTIGDDTGSTTVTAGFD